MQLSTTANFIPYFEDRSQKRLYLLINLLRALLLAAAFIFIDQISSIKSSHLAILFASFCAVFSGAKLAFSKLKILTIFMLLLCTAFACKLILSIVLWIWIPKDPNTFYLAGLSNDLEIGIYLVLILAFATTLFWRIQAVLTIETILLCMLCISLVSAHRNFHFDMPQLITKLAWSFGIEHLSALIALGTALTLISIGYIWSASLPNKPVANNKNQLATEHHNFNRLQQPLLLLLVLSVILYLIWNSVYQRFEQIASSVTQNGVGQENDAGLSPLGFHSALGSNNQPAALVRLEGDYTDNPNQPMLYLREGALSDFNGIELVNANANYDQDVSKHSADLGFEKRPDSELSNRVQIIQSIYLLANHKNAFSADYPISIRPLNNPNPGRFKSAYRAYSLAPTYKLSQISNYKVGDKRWSNDTWQHYLKVHQDKRYADLASEIAADRSSAAEKAQAVADYLSKTAIYTLTPNHETKKDQDKVAPFLFGDKRGYCVHFAHAMVYMFRALGIPSRIGTGYLTDLSQSKDGHLLLRMSDRHAWAEIYLESLGWVVYDVQPEKVENHADTQVDLKLLEELMGMLDPGQEILPKDLANQEPALQEQPLISLPFRELFKSFLIGLIIVFVSLKLFLRFGYLFPATAKARARNYYRAVASRLADLGFERSYAETRKEFCQRLNEKHALSIKLISSDITSNLYNRHYSSNLLVEAKKCLDNDLKRIRALPLYKRVMAAIRPKSVLHLLTGETW